MFKSYYDDLARLIFRPILFFTRMPQSGWFEKPVTFLGLNILILSLLMVVVIFITQYMPIGSTLYEKVNPSRIIFTLPVMVVLSFTFSAIAFSIVFAVLLVLFLLLFWVLALIMYQTGNLLGGNGDYIEYVKASFYSSGVFIAFAVIILTIIPAKNGALDFTKFVVGYNILYSFVVLYLYGLFAIIIRKLHKVSKTKAFIGALVPAVFLAIIGIFIGHFILPKLQGLIV